MQNHITVIGIGAVTSVGLSAVQTAASVRAGISRFTETSGLDRMFAPIVMALLPDDILPQPDPLLPDFPGISNQDVRMLQLGALAMVGALEGIDTRDPLPVFLGLPENQEKSKSEKNRDFVNLLGVQSGLKIDIAASKLYPNGRAAGIYAIREAVELLEVQQHNYILVGGVDTYWNSPMLKRLDNEGRINSPFNPDGFIPGEGAGFMLLSTLKSAERIGVSPLAFIEGISIGYEEGNRYSNEIYKGDGLAETIQNLTKSCIGGDPIRTVYAGFTGENYFAKEWGVAFIRNSDLFYKDFALEHPADCVGDTGAAMGLIMTILSVIAMQKRYRRGPCIVWCTSDYGNCGALKINSYP